MSEKRHRSGGGKKQVLVWIAWGILIALLGSNLVMFFAKDDEVAGTTGEGFITLDMLQRAGFWAPLAAAWLFALCGLFWVASAYKHSERASLLWAKRGYITSILGALALSIAFYEPDIGRTWFGVVAAAVFGAQTVIFALLARSEYRRAETGEGTRHPRRHGDKLVVPTLSAGAQSPAGPAESPGAGR